LFQVPIVALIVMSILRDPLRTSIGFVIVLLGVPVSSLVLARRRSVGETVKAPSTS
jgi:hypothetical protein